MFHVKQLPLENITECPFCQSAGFEKHLEAQDYLTEFGIFSIVVCNECGLLFTNPRPVPEAISSVYPSSKYLSHQNQKNTLFERVYFGAQKLMLKRKHTLVNKLVNPQSALLDIGCGIGNYASFMSSKGYYMVGIEPSTEARAVSKTKGFKVFESLKEYHSSNLSKPQLISLWHVLEHQPNPFESLAQYYEMLPLNGWLIIAVPQYQSLDARFYKNKWAAYDLPRHLFHFSEKSLNRAAENAGFVHHKTIGMPFDAFYVSLLSQNNVKSLLGLPNALLIGFASNFVAWLRLRPWSSQIFVFQKR